MSRTTVLLDQADRDRLAAIREYLVYSYGESPRSIGELIRYTISLAYQMQEGGQIDTITRITACGHSARRRGRPRRPAAPATPGPVHPGGGADE